MIFHASAPGSLMIMGEHAVLHNHPCLITSISSRIHVKLKPRNDKIVSITSILGKWKGILKNFPQKCQYQFIVKTIEYFNPNNGFDLFITNEFQSNIGLGSSTAVVVSMFFVFNEWMKTNFHKQKILLCCIKVIQSIQKGIGSGADVAASIYGGLIIYRKIDSFLKSTIIIRSLSFKLPYSIFVIYSGRKISTFDVVQYIEKKICPKKKFFLYRKIGKLVKKMEIYLSKKDNNKIFNNIITSHRKIQKQLNLHTPQINWIFKKLKDNKKIYCFKISGAGLGDCIIGFGKCSKKLFKYKYALKNCIFLIPIQIGQMSDGAKIHI